MAGFSLSGVIAELQKLAAEAPDFLAGLPAMLDNFSTLTAPEVAVLAKWFPSLPTLEATVVADLKAVIALFQKLGPAVPYVVRFLTFLNSIFGPPAPAGAVTAAAPGQTLPGAQYPL